MKQIKSAFYSLSKVYNLTPFFTTMMMVLLLNLTPYFPLQFFGESKIVEYHVQENDIAPGKKEVRDSSCFSLLLVTSYYYNLIFKGNFFII